MFARERATQGERPHGRAGVRACACERESVCARMCASLARGGQPPFPPDNLAHTTRAVCYTLIELDECGEERNGEVQQILQKLTGRGTVPNVIVGGKCIGGGEELERMQLAGKLKPLLAAAGCAFE